jgi:hypothetical protein
VPQVSSVRKAVADPRLRYFDKQISHQGVCLVKSERPKQFGTLEEYLLTIFAFERELTDRERVFVNLRFELAERALQLDHVEMLRRLDLLNRAHEDARQKEASFVGREVYESQAKDSNKWRDEVNSARCNRQGNASVTSGLAGALEGWP